MQLARLLIQQRPQLLSSTWTRHLSFTPYQLNPQPRDPADLASPLEGSAAYTHEEEVLKRELPESPESFVDEGQGMGNVTEEELTQRKSAAVKAWMEAQVGSEKVAVAQILKDHNVLVRGGPEQGTKLMDALVAWKQGQAPV